QGFGGRHLRAHHVVQLLEPFLVHGEQSRRKDETIAFGEEQQQFGDGPRERQLRQQFRNQRTLARRRNRGVGERALQFGKLLQERGDAGQVLGALFGSGLLEQD